MKNHIKMNKNLLIIVFLIIFSCNNKNEIKFIEVNFTDPEVHNSIYSECRELYGFKSHKQKISDVIFLSKLESELKNLEQNIDLPYERTDIRLGVVIHYINDKISDTLCLSEIGKVKLNFKVMKESKTLFELVANKVDIFNRDHYKNDAGNKLYKDYQKYKENNGID